MALEKNRRSKKIRAQNERQHLQEESILPLQDSIPRDKRNLLHRENLRKRKKRNAPSKNVPRLTKEEQKKLRTQQKQERAIARKEAWVSFAAALKEFFVRMGMVLAVLFIIGGIMVTITLKSEIDMLKFKNNELSSQLDQKKEVIKELNSKKEATYKSETIENLARYRLGMVYPTKEQTVYIYLD